MTSSIPEQQYNPQALSGGFNPIEQVDLAPAIAAEQARQMAPMKDQLAQIAANDRVAIQNAGQSSRDLQALGSFSSTLSDYLVERQKVENEKAMQRGIMMRYTEGTSPEEAAAFNESEAMLEGAKVAAEQDAAEAEANGASVFTGEKIRSLSGWEKYGYAKADMQIASQGFPVYMAQNADKISVQIDGRTVTLNSAKTPEEASAVLSKMVAGYLRPFNGYNPTMVDKYLLTPMRGLMQQQMVLFAQRRGAEIKTERLIERKNDLLLNLDTPGVSSKFVKQHPNGVTAGRIELADIIDRGLKDGSITPEQAEILITDPVTFNGDKAPSNFRDKFPAVFGGIPQLIEDVRLGDISRNNQIKTAEAKQFVDGLIEIATADDNQVDRAEKAAGIQAWRAKYPGRPVPAELSGLYTVDDATLEEQEAFLTQIAEANGGQIPPQYTIGKDPNVLAKFKDQLNAGIVVQNALKQFKEPRKAFITGLLKENQKLDQGGNVIDAEAATVQYNMGKKFDELFAKYSINQTPEEAFASAREQMLTIPYEKFKSIGTVDQEALKNRRLANNAYGADPSKLDSEVLPGVQQSDLQAAYKYLTTGRGNVPYIFKYIAERSLLSPEEIAAKQLEASGYKNYKIPESEIDITNNGSEQVKRLLRYKNTPSRTLRAYIEDPELVNVLDVIASKESYSYGGYDAYNLGGSDNGYTAHDPGNSAEDGRFGKPVSQLTVGEILKLHSQGKLHAVGRYQFIQDTFKEVVQGLRVPRDAVFNAQVQDAMALYRLRWRLNLQNSTTGLINEWRGLKFLKPAQLQQLLQDAQDVYDPYNRPELLLKGLNGTN